MDFNEMIHLLAVINGLPKQYILQEMQSPIDESCSNPDPKIQAAWLSMPFSVKSRAGAAHPLFDNAHEKT